MKYVRTSHYVEKSYDGLPSFIIILKDDNKEEISFISNGCVFLEVNQSNLEFLISKYDCKEYIDKLLSSPIKSDSEITNARFMFWNSKELKEIDIELPNATNCTFSLIECSSLVSANISLPKAKNCDFLLQNCYSLEKATLDIPNIENYSWVFAGCRSLKIVKLEAPKNLYFIELLEYCPLNKKDVEFIGKKSLFLLIWNSLCKLVKIR